MNEFEKMKKFFDEFKIEYETITAEDAQGEEVNTMGCDGEITWDTLLRIKHGIGYYNFYIDFYFLLNKYQGHGVWE